MTQTTAQTQAANTLDMMDHYSLSFTPPGCDGTLDVAITEEQYTKIKFFAETILGGEIPTEEPRRNWEQWRKDLLAEVGRA